MHAGRPYGLHVVGDNLTDKDQAFIDATAMRFTNLKNVSNVDTLKLSYELPDGGSFIIQDAGGNFRVIAHKPPVSIKPPEFDGLPRMYVPMLYSGAIAGRTILRPDQGLTLNISNLTQKRLAGYDPKRTPAPKYLELQRFACKYGPQFQEFMPEQPIMGVVYTQYEQQRPTWYSGAMSEVMQIVGGYGKQDISKLPDDQYERAQFIIPEPYRELIEAELKGVRLPAYTGLPHADGEFQYSYKFFSTNLVSFDDEKNPWLVRVGSLGVWAMPLPVIPATTTAAFYEYMASVGDSEVLAILDRFGGMPSGEGFPLGEAAFEAWRRAGVIIKVCDTKDFYQYLPYSTAIGWSSNTDGTEAVNTAYELDFDSGRITAVAYKLRLRLSAAKNKGWAIGGDARLPKTDLEMSRILAYLSKLHEQLKENNVTNIAIKYKLRTVDIEDIQQRAWGIFNSDIEVRYWNNLELDPIATHTGSVTQIDKGVYFGGWQVKVPEPIFRGCVSLPFPAPDVKDRSGKKDTTVLAYYIGDSLKTIKLFQDDRKQNPSIETDFEEYMYVGKWHQKELRGDAYIKGSLYATDIDDRFVAAATEIVTDVEGKDLGFGLPEWHFNFYFWTLGNIERFRYYSTKTDKVTTTDKSISLAAVIPYLNRNMLIYAKTETSGRVVSESSLSLNRVKDPYYYDMWTYHKDFAYNGVNNPSNGKPFPVDGYPVHAEKQHYSPHPSNDFANDGPWVSSLPSDISSMMYDYTPRTVWQLIPTIPKPKLNTYNRSSSTQTTSKESLKCQVFDRIDNISDKPHTDAYYILSPINGDVFFYEDGCKVVFGNKRYANISEVTETGNRKQWGESTLVNNKSAHHFIGVINE